jgi:LysM repeat protein
MDGQTSTGKLGQAMARAFALLAIAAAAVALAVVVSDSLSDSGGDGDKSKRAHHQRTQTQTRPEEETYVVQEGDSLTGIAEQTGVSLRKLQAYNCNIDPQALPSGATLQLTKPAEGC